MRRRRRARELALKILYQINITGEGYKESMATFWKSHKTSQSVKEFATLLVTGTMENIAKIDEIISKYAMNWQIKRMAVVDRNILRMGTYELLYLPDIPPKVSINEAVDIAKKYSDPQSGKFVNGILDKIHQMELAKRVESRE